MMPDKDNVELTKQELQDRWFELRDQIMEDKGCDENEANRGADKEFEDEFDMDPMDIWD